MTEDGYLSLYTREALAKACAKKDESIDQLKDENTELRKLTWDALRPKYDMSLRMPPAKWREYDADVLRRAHKLGIVPKDIEVD